MRKVPVRSVYRVAAPVVDVHGICNALSQVAWKFSGGRESGATGLRDAMSMPSAGELPAGIGLVAATWG
ncbi:hypothetical protein DVU_1779 [Nitratidesulfovibrio vulgaris str. Hildenborough]|uniref:Uncharacterized protein n=1 Tax=Nitratidesulfovibrio vulgaris (strain ATCC 29579 / DSM 644 / CCUG 34227 / NCIMB 8303 / VKM B-1760 / Hildenborough) TaxID=882 RepID=Q72B59_NITV2|nr:hypothetical protein DVU_1779 [Nitratidesulfovibrio vulgaris str. Hildenborough]